MHIGTLCFEEHLEMTIGPSQVLSLTALITCHKHELLNARTLKSSNLRVQVATDWAGCLGTWHCCTLRSEPRGAAQFQASIWFWADGTLTLNPKPQTLQPKGSMQVYGIYLGPKGVPIYILESPSISHIPTWTLWEARQERHCNGFRQVIR